MSKPKKPQATPAAEPLMQVLDILLPLTPGEQRRILRTAAEFYRVPIEIPEPAPAPEAA